jgi:hypothetical protein
MYGWHVRPTPTARHGVCVPCARTAHGLTHTHAHILQLLLVKILQTLGADAAVWADAAVGMLIAEVVQAGRGQARVRPGV